MDLLAPDLSRHDIHSDRIIPSPETERGYGEYGLVPYSTHAVRPLSFYNNTKNTRYYATYVDNYNTKTNEPHKRTLTNPPE